MQGNALQCIAVRCNGGRAHPRERWRRWTAATSRLDRHWGPAATGGLKSARPTPGPNFFRRETGTH
eukprot:2471466-Pyramimonas_sp.AAC.1